MAWINSKYNIGDTVFRIDMSRHRQISPSFFIIKEKIVFGKCLIVYKSFIKHRRVTYSFTSDEKNLYSIKALLLEKNIF